MLLALRKFSVLSLIALLGFSTFPVVTSAATTYYNGPKGGCYYLSAKNKKVYVSHKFCNRDDEGTNGVYNAKTKKTYYTGPKGGCFYYSGNNEKNYVKHSYCNR